MEPDFIKEFGGLGVAIGFMSIMLRWFMTRNEQLMLEIKTTIQAHSEVIHELRMTLQTMTYLLRPDLEKHDSFKEK